MSAAISTTQAQQYTARRGHDRKMLKMMPDSLVTPQMHIDYAGRRLQKSASWQNVAIPSLILSAASFSGEIFHSRRTSNAFGIFFGFIFFTSESFSIGYKYSAGKELRLSGAGLTMTF